MINNNPCLSLIANFWIYKHIKRNRFFQEIDLTDNSDLNDGCWTSGWMRCPGAWTQRLIPHFIFVCVNGWFMVFNTTANNISGVSWRSVLLEEEIGVPGENNRPVASHWQTWSHVLSSIPRQERGSNSQL
jgi:hypothetical protein